MRIRLLKAFKILDSRGDPAIAIRVNKFWSGVPAGASTSKSAFPAYPREVDGAITLFNKVASKLEGFEINSFDDFIKLEDSIPMKNKLGANPIIALEYAILKALANEQKVEIFELLSKPNKNMLPLGNVIGGGAHAGIRAPDFQEFLLCPRTNSFSEAAFINAEIHSNLKKTLAKLDPFFMGSKTDEGAWVTGISVIEIAQLLHRICDDKIRLGIDAAASRLYHDEKYHFHNWSKSKNKRILSPNACFEEIRELANKFDLFYIEDPFQEKDFNSFVKLTSKLKGRLVCADDLTATNPQLLSKVIKLKAANAVIVKPNQIGSLVLAKKFFDEARKVGLKTVVSHRSAEMPDAILAHIALGWGADYFKCGIAGGERISKINDIIRIEADF